LKIAKDLHSSVSKFSLMQGVASQEVNY